MGSKHLSPSAKSQARKNAKQSLRKGLKKQAKAFKDSSY